MTERADSLVNNRSPRYLHGFQKDTNETTELPHTVPVGNQVTYTDSFTNYGVDTVYGKEYVIAAGSPPTVHNSLPGRSDTDTHPASSITNTPVAPITSTNVQGALNEVASLADSASSAASTALSTANSAASAATYADALARSSYNLIKNGNSEMADPTGYEAAGVTTSNPRTGTKCRAVTGTAGYSGLDLLALQPCSPGDQVYFLGWGLCNKASDGQGRAWISWRNASGAEIGVSVLPLILNWAAYTKFELKATAPAGAQFFSVVVGNYNGTGTTYYFDDLYACRMISAGMLEDDAVRSTTHAFAVSDTTASTSTTTGAIVAAGGIATGDCFTGRYRSQDGSAGLTATRTFYAASTSGGAVNVLNTVTIKDGIITAWTQA